MKTLTFALQIILATVLALPARAEIAPTYTEASFTERDARQSLRIVRDRVKSGLYSLKGYGTVFGLTAIVVTLVHSLNPASLIRLAGVKVGSLATLGLGYWLLSTGEAQTGTLAEPYLRTESGMTAFLNLSEDQQMSIMRGDRRMVEAIQALGRRAMQLDQVYASAN